MRTVRKCNERWIKVSEVWDCSQHLSHWGIFNVVIEDKGFRRMTSEVMQQMCRRLKVWSSRQIHMPTKTTDGIGLLVTRVGEPIETSNQFQTLESTFVLKGSHLLLRVGIVSFREIRISLHGRGASSQVSLGGRLIGVSRQESVCHRDRITSLIDRSVLIFVLLKSGLQVPISFWTNFCIKSLTQSE